MKKLEITIVMACLMFLVGIVFLLAGCNAQNKPVLIDQLISLNTTVEGYQWKEAFGNTIESRQSFNLRIINDQWKVINKRIESLEKQTGILAKIDAKLQDRINALEDKAKKPKEIQEADDFATMENRFGGVP